MLKETINSQSFTQGLANHFGTKASIKNMLSGKKNMRAIQPLFEDTKYAEEILEYGNIREVLNEILDDVFREYIKVFNKKLPEGELGNTKDRVQMFIGLFDERLNKEPEGGIISSFADFAKSATGKKITKVLKESGNESNEDLMDVIAYIAIRSVIINADKLVEPSKKGELVEISVEKKSEPPVLLVEEPQESEPIEVEIVTLPENHPHTKVEPRESEPKGITDPNDILNNILKNPIAYEDDRIKNVVDMVFPDGKIGGKFLDKINSYPTRSECYDMADVIEYQLPPMRKTHIGLINISSFIRFVLSVSLLDTKGNIEDIPNDIILAANYLVFAALNIILNEDISCRDFISGILISSKHMIQDENKELKRLPNMISNVYSNINEEQTSSLFARMRAHSISAQILRDSAVSRMNKAYTEFGIV